MNVQERPVDWSLQKFGIGQPVPRTEDPRLVRGEGQYTDDVNLPGQAYAAIVRSRHAHGVIRACDVAAARATRLTLINSRLVVNAMEPRAAIAAYDTASGRFTLHTGCQGVFGLKGQLADILGVPGDKVHVLAGNVGGSFGMKAAAYPEY